MNFHIVSAVYRIRRAVICFPQIFLIAVLNQFVFFTVPRNNKIPFFTAVFKMTDCPALFLGKLRKKLFYAFICRIFAGLAVSEIYNSPIGCIINLIKRKSICVFRTMLTINLHHTRTVQNKKLFFRSLASEKTGNKRKYCN